MEDLIIQDPFLILGISLGLVLYFIFHYFCNVARAKVYTSNGSLKEFLDEHSPTLKQDYWPPWFAWGGRVQSALGINIRMNPNTRLPYQRDILNLKDGGQLGVDFLEALDFQSTTEKRLVVLILPGLTSSSNESYVKTLALGIVQTGAIVAIMNKRGLGGVPLTTPRTYSVIDNEDIEEVIIHIKNKFPGVDLFPIGTSLGGMSLSRYLTNHPKKAKENFVAAMVISICWDPLIGNENLERPLINRYGVNYVLAHNLKRTVRRNQAILEGSNCWDFKQVMTAKTIREFDEFFTTRQFGYSSWQEYYKAAQITPDIYKLSIPVFALNAMDDPMQPAEHLPMKEALAERSNLALVVTKRGGHLGFLEARLPFRKPFHYLERVVAEIVLGIRLNSSKLQATGEK